ncbi:31675_t:CDS:10, partial [Racocetra persica]
GGFGKCYEVEDKEGRVLAVKVVAKSSLRSLKNRDKLLSEIQIHKKMDHPHIVKFYECCEDPSFVYMIMELCENKTLAYMNKRRQRLTEAEVRYFMRQLLDACEYMHRNFVIHRDLKLANLFLSKDMKIKIGDFGLAAQLEREGDRKKTICGTPNYIAPEVLFDQVKGHSFEADVWSLGVIMPPFQTEGKVDQIYKKIKELKYDFPGNINDVSKEAKALINLMLTLDPEKRPTIQQVRDHDFFRLGVTPSEIPVSALTIAPSFELPPLTRPRINLSLANRRPLRVIQIGTNLNNLNSTAASVAKKSIYPVEVKPLPLRSEKKLVNSVASKPEPKPNSTEAPLISASAINSARVQNIANSIANAIVPNCNNASSTSSTCITKKDSSNKTRVGVLESVYNTLSTAFDQMLEGKEVLPHVFDKQPTTPLVFISKWMDYTNKYGLGYQLTDGSVGVNFNDKTTLIMSPNGHIYITIKPQQINFRNYMNEVLPKISTTYTFVDNNRTNNMEFLTKYKRTPHAVLFRLSNRLVQVNFFDHEKIILSEEGRVITYIDEARGINTHTISEILKGDHATEKNRLKYVKDVLKKLVEAAHKNSKPE